MWSLCILYRNGADTSEPVVALLQSSSCISRKLFHASGALIFSQLDKIMWRNAFNVRCSVTERTWFWMGAVGSKTKASPSPLHPTNTVKPYWNHTKLVHLRTRGLPIKHNVSFGPQAIRKLNLCTLTRNWQTSDGNWTKVLESRSYTGLPAVGFARGWCTKSCSPLLPTFFKFWGSRPY